jgi:hypothetical protein
MKAKEGMGCFNIDKSITFTVTAFSLEIGQGANNTSP